jgi:hypothetical protein
MSVHADTMPTPAKSRLNEKSNGELRNRAEQFGLDIVHAYIGHVQDNAEQAVRRVLCALKDSIGTILSIPPQRSRCPFESAMPTAQRLSTPPARHRNFQTT